jgi:hypothetical protein
MPCNDKPAMCYGGDGKPFQQVGVRYFQGRLLGALALERWSAENKDILSVAA